MMTRWFNFFITTVVGDVGLIFCHVTLVSVPSIKPWTTEQTKRLLLSNLTAFIVFDVHPKVL